MYGTMVLPKPGLVSHLQQTSVTLALTNFHSHHGTSLAAPLGSNAGRVSTPDKKRSRRTTLNVSSGAASSSERSLSRIQAAVTSTRQSSKQESWRLKSVSGMAPAISQQKVADSAKLAAFWDWLIAKGAVVPGKTPVKIAEVPEGLGLVATRDISSSEDVFSVPESICISLEDVRRSPLGPLVGDLKPWIQLALFLSGERVKAASPWRPYLDILPETPPSPLFWSAEELAELDGTQVRGSVANYEEFLAEEFARLDAEMFSRQRSIFPEGAFTLENFRWAFGILRSRTFAPLVGDNICLVPLGDMINHGSGGSAPEKAVWEKKSEGLFGGKKVVAMAAKRSYTAGEQVIMEYGTDKSNGQLLLDFGFVDFASPSVAAVVAPGAVGGGPERDLFSLTLAISESDRFFDDKADVAELAGLTGTAVYFDLIRGEPVPEEMLAFLRLISLGGADSFHMEALFRDRAWGHMLMPVSKENEESICQTMVDGCQGALAGYRTTDDEDRAIIADTGAPPRLRACAAVRLGEKAVLAQTLAFFQERAKELDGIEYYAEMRLRGLGLIDDGGNMTPWQRMWD